MKKHNNHSKDSKRKNTFLSFFFLFYVTHLSFAQSYDSLVVDYQNPQKYEIEHISVSGIQFLDTLVIKSMSGLREGEFITIPGNEIPKLIKKFWDQGLFSDVKISACNLHDGKVSLDIYLKERPRLSAFTIDGIKKSEIKDLTEKLNIRTGSQVTENLLNTITHKIKTHYVKKGFFNVAVTIEQIPDESLPNRVKLIIHVKKNERVKIKDIYFTGNTVVPDKKLRRLMKKTHRRDWNIFHTSKYIEEDFAEDKEKIIKYYNKNGYRDARIVSDSISFFSPERIFLHIHIYEGHKYFFGNINWIGNTKYPSALLDQLLGIKKGDVFDQELLEKRLTIDENSVSSLYLDNGYLFFNVTPVEMKIYNDTIDFEMRIYEGKQATINEVIISGNTKTNEHVVRREVRTLPAELFSKSDIIRTVRELATLGHFEPEKIEPNPIPNPSEGTVDIEYRLVERANDQLELSAGYGAKMFIGTIGLRFSNFSARNIANLKMWRPIPSGDGQTLSIRAQSNGSYYRSINLSFVEPWFGGKKPNSLSFTVYHSKLSSGYNMFYRYSRGSDTNYLKMSGISLGLGRRLQFPDDFFTLYNELSYQRYLLQHYHTSYGSFVFSDGVSHNINLTTTLTRNSVNSPIYPRSGAKFSISLQATPPWSYMNYLLTGNKKDYSQLPANEKYKLIEYHKWSFKSEYYLKLAGDLVLMARAQFGFLGMYNRQIGPSPFESFDLGGSGMMFSYNLYGREIVALRGYSDQSLTPRVSPDGKVITYKDYAGLSKSGNIYDKFTMELRYPITLKEMATVYALAFLEGGKAWYDFKSFNPFDIHRSAGVGLRAFLPMFGMLGFDWGYGFDPIPGLESSAGSQFHFIIGQPL